MGKSKTASKKKSKPTTKAHAVHKPVKKTVARPTKSTAKKEPVAKKPSKSSHASDKAKKPEKHSSAPKAKVEHPPAKAKAAPKTEVVAPAAPATATDKPAPRLTPDELRKQLMAKAKSRTKTQRASTFTLDDVRGELARAGTVRPAAAPKAPKGEAAAKPAAAPAAPAQKPIPKIEQRQFGAASLADILGYNPVKDEKPEDEEAQIDKKFIRYYKLLVELREHVKSGLDIHTEETLKRSSRDDSGDLSGYGQHMADAGTDNFDRDFALSLVSNEQEALYEIEEAIKRIKNGTYGICELTGKPISKDRLLAVPFARFSVESQAEIEKTKRRSASRGGAFGEAGTEEGARIVEEESE